MSRFHLTKAKKFLPVIVFIGIGIGAANYFLNSSLNLSQSIIVGVATSLVIGYSTVTIASNKDWFYRQLKTPWKIYSCITLLFFFIGGLSTELEHTILSFLFSKEDFQFFSAPKMNLFNGIITFILGHTFFQNHATFPKTNKPKNEQDAPSTFTKVPVKEGNSIRLIHIDDIAYFEAFDNYSHVYNLKREKRLCDYSLAFLQTRLGSNFMRIHRKYIVNKDQIKQIQSHTNSRYKIYFEIEHQSPIVSSKSYAAEIKELTKLK